MDDKSRKSCLNCCERYFLKSQPCLSKGNLPLFLPCGHTACENCIRGLTMFQKPIQCKICLHRIEIKADILRLTADISYLYQIFPVNLQVLGELALQLMNVCPKAAKPVDEYHIDIHGIMMNQGACAECQNWTYKMCKQCDIVFCETCFNKSHQNFLYNNHTLQNIVSTHDSGNNCEDYYHKQFEYYCNDCSKAIDKDCLKVDSDKSCQGHNLKSISEINDTHIKALMRIQPKVDEIFRRLTKTAVDINQQLYDIDNGTGTPSDVTQIITAIEQHFSRLCAIIQKHKQETLALATKVKCNEKESLLKAKKDVIVALKKAILVMRMVDADVTKFKQENLSELLRDAKKVVEAPWFLFKEEDKTNTFKIKVNEYLNLLISEYIILEGNSTPVYKLCRLEDLEGVEIPPAPPVPVYPQQLPRENPVQDIPSIISYTLGQDKRLPLVEGSQELVYILHIVDPHNFFVQRASDQKLVKDILREYRNSASELKPLLEKVAEGNIYLAYSKVDTTWKRCRILSIEKNEEQPRFTVYCFDFGNIEAVSIDNLRLLPAKGFTLPPMAIHCSLANCKPINGEWMNEDSILINNILENKRAIIHVRRVIENEGGTKLDCDVFTSEQKFSLAHAFVFHGRAKMLNPGRKYPNIKTIEGIPKIFTSNGDFKPKSTDDIYFTHIVSPDKFFLRKRQQQSDYYRLSKEVNKAYSLDLDRVKIFLPEVGMACVVNTEKYRNVVENSPVLGEECAWARCVVTELATRGRVRVQLVDWGLYLLVHWSSLRAIHSRFTTLKALATECHLAGVTPYNKRWHPASIALLKKYQNHVLGMEVVENKRDSIGVCLLDKTDEENIVCINDEMVKFKFAITFRNFSLPRNNENLKDQSFNYKSPLDKPTRPKPKSVKIRILKRGDPQLKCIEEEEEDLVTKDKGPLRLEATILNYISPSEIYLRFLHQQESFSRLFNILQSYYNESKTEGKTEWQVNEKCCTVCFQSQTWRRATILELNGASAKVFYDDFAIVESVQTSALKILAPEFASINVAALRCHISGVMPATGNKWPSITKDFLKELLKAYNRIFITKSGYFKGKSMPIEIWVYHTIHGGAIEPNVTEWRCLNNKIIEQGLGIPITDQWKADQNEKESEYKVDDIRASFLNVASLASKWLQKPMLTKAVTESGSIASTIIECEDAYENGKDDEQIVNSSIFISEWLEAEPFPNTEFTAIATFIDNYGIIYLHDVSQEDTYDLISNALSGRYRNPDPKANYVKWTVGEPCIALYLYDNRFYRGIVVEVNQIASNCIVHFIDYGNEEVCSFGNMRKSIALHQIPIQAHKCILSRVQPEGAQWERQTLDYIRKLILKKQCFVKVVGKALDGITPIDMKYDKLWINDHLVDFNLAKYVDGVVKPKRNTKNQIMAISEMKSNIETNFRPDY